MPFGRKVSYIDGVMYDFDAIYIEGIAPAIADAGGKAIRADMEIYGGIIHKPLFERILQADVLIADLTTANPNIFYELGIRHAARKGVTILVVASSERIPFDLALMRAIIYKCEDGRLSRDSVEQFRRALVEQITAGFHDQTLVDSPLFMLLDNYPGVELPRAVGGAQVFLSYAREDEEHVLRIYSQLEIYGFRPWMDQRNITPGERWELAIDTALRRADFILVFLSKLSIQKRGYLRREIRDAVDRAREMLDTDIFIVPVRLDDCTIPQELADFQWVDLFRENGISRLVDALQSGLKRRNKEVTP